MKSFIDTNVIAHAYDRKAGKKHEKTKALLVELWRAKTRPVISTQVIQELHTTLNKFGYPPEEAIQITHRFLSWKIVSISPSLLESAFDFRLKNQLSVWDCSIVAAAVRARCTKLLTEDLNEGQNFGDCIVEKPFG